MAQRQFCSKLIVVPLSVFHRMAESLGDPKCELIFVFIAGRCGSTILMKVIITQYYDQLWSWEIRVIFSIFRKGFYGKFCIAGSLIYSVAHKNGQ